MFAATIMYLYDDLYYKHSTADRAASPRPPLHINTIRLAYHRISRGFPLT